MRHAIGLAAAVALLAQQGTALAQSEESYSANFMMPGCRKATSQIADFLAGACVGNIRAMLFLSSRLAACTPQGVNVEQALRVVIRYIDQRPERMHERFENLALEALQQAWPCRSPTR